MSYGTEFNKAEAFALLRDRGAKGAVVSYSGGNDEGGVDDVILILEDDTTVSIRETYVGYEYNAEDKYVKSDKVLTPEQARDNALIDQLGAPVYSRYYSFAGDFYCSGEVIYDVAAYTVKMDGKESEESYLPVEESF